MQRSSHVIVVGNEKGGSGKTTTAMHLAVALMTSGHRVATIDLDSRQRSLTRYVENRRETARSRSVVLHHPTHHVVARAKGDSVRANAWTDYEAFARVLGEVEETHDFVVIDTPGSDTPLARMAHGAADTLVTPLNDSFVDIDVIGAVTSGEGARVMGPSHYAEMVADARRERRAVADGTLDWVVLRNRLGSFDTKNRRQMATLLDELATKLGFRLSPGIGERVIFRELFPTGLTVLDPFSAFTTGKPSMSHLAARQEVRSLVEALRLPFAEIRTRRAELREEWERSAANADRAEDILVAASM